MGTVLVRREILAAEYRRVMGSYPTGVTIVTATGDDGWPLGMTIGTFTSVSLDPPLVGFFPAKNSGSWAQIAATGSFCVNVLGDEQEELCRRFGARADDRFDQLDWRAAPISGSPVIGGVLAWFDCTTHAVVDAGDHWFVMGSVHELQARSGLPLIFFGGAFDTVQRKTPQPT